MQRSYADVRRRDLSFKVDDHVYLKVSPMRGIRRFNMKGKLAPRYIGPFKILEKKGEVVHRLELPPSLSGVHNVFHVSQLKKCLRVPEEQAPLEGLEVQEDLTYTEYPVKILDTSERNTKNKKIKMCRVQWNHHTEAKATWEREDELKAAYIPKKKEETARPATPAGPALPPLACHPRHLGLPLLAHTQAQAGGPSAPPLSPLSPTGARDPLARVVCDLLPAPLPLMVDQVPPPSSIFPALWTRAPRPLLRHALSTPIKGPLRPTATIFPSLEALAHTLASAPPSISAICARTVSPAAAKFAAAEAFPNLQEASPPFVEHRNRSPTLPRVHPPYGEFRLCLHLNFSPRWPSSPF
ncbi:hypothetical protein U9M48_031931 [Paspalum notatum var. saurae]|uniref:Tf2-1-like SH3-like domain-containing protein n=1 Tax=Paspalum notatum var. saurae TaxID=547442 RepID=A0AAQ3X4W0_PASNO